MMRMLRQSHRRDTRLTNQSKSSEQSERILEALQEMDRSGRMPADVQSNPGQFLRDLYEVWHRQGGKEGGRWRNSIRKMREEWLVGRNAVPSLHPKLMGRVKVTQSDVKALVDLFLIKWRFPDAGETNQILTSDGFASYQANDLNKLRENIVNSLFVGDRRARGFQLPQSDEGQSKFEETERNWNEIEKILRQSNALITMSKHKIAVGPTPSKTISNTWHLLDEVYKYDRENDFPDRLLIWIVDLGSRDVDSPHSFDGISTLGFR